MKKTRMVKLLAVAMSATLILQPMAVFAEEGTPIAAPAPAVEAPAPVAEAPAPAPAVEAPAPAAEAPAPAPQMNDQVEAAVENAEDAVKAALPPTEIAQQPTDKYLDKTEDHLENMDRAIENLDKVTDKATEEINEFTDALGTAVQSEAAFDQAASDAKAYADQAVKSTANNITAAAGDADRVEEMAAVMYENQQAAQQAYNDATAVAKAAQDEADAAAETARILEGKLDDAETKMNQAKADYEAALDEYEEAIKEVVKAQAVLKVTKTYAGMEGAVAVADAKKALDNAEAAQKRAERLKNEKEGTYNNAVEELGKAREEAEEAKGKLDDAKQALSDADRELKKAELIVAINQTEANEITTYNGYANNNGKTEQDVKDADIELVKGLIRYQLFDTNKVDDADDIVFTESEEGTIIATYRTRNEDGETVEVVQKFKFDPAQVQDIHGKENSYHWLVITTVESESAGTQRVKVGTEYYYTKNGQEMNVEKYFTHTDMYKTAVVGNQLIVYKRYGFGWDYHKSFTIHTRDKYEDQECTVYETSDFYTEEAYYRANNGFTGIDKIREDRNKADQEVKNLEDAIGRPAALEEALAGKKSEADAAKEAFDEADSKYTAVKKAYQAVKDAACAINNLKANNMPAGSDIVLAILWADYNWRVGEYNRALKEFETAAANAKLTQDEADRALAALGDGFNYNTTPSGQPSGEPSGEPANDEPAYVPSAPIAAAPVAPAPEAAVLGATRARGSAAVKEAGEGEEEIKEEAPIAVAKKQEEKKEDKKPAVAIEDEETAKAAAPIEVQKGFPWWVLIILAAIAALSIEEYVRRKNAKENAQG